MKTYKSDRDLPLIYQGDTPKSGKYILTVENYLKWYSIYRVDCEGNISYLPDHHEVYEEKTEDIAWSDHVPMIDYCIWLTKTFPEYEWDNNSLDMIAGRHFWRKRGCYE